MKGGPDRGTRSRIPVDVTASQNQRACATAPLNVILAVRRNRLSLPYSRSSYGGLMLTAYKRVPASGRLHPPRSTRQAGGHALSAVVAPLAELQRQANSSDATTRLAALQRRADAIHPAHPHHVVQRVVEFTKNYNNNLDDHHSSKRKAYVKTKLIEALIAKFNSSGPEPAEGWKAEVWKMERDTLTKSFDDLQDLADTLQNDFPRRANKRNVVPEDPAFRSLIEDTSKKYDPTRTTKPEKQVWGLHNLAVHGTPQEKQDTVNFLKQPNNLSGLEAQVRHGGLNETILTKDGPEAARRSFGMDPAVESMAPVDSGKDNMTWTRMQEETSLQTEKFIFKGTHHLGGSHKHFQDTHVNGKTYYFNAKGERKQTIGNTSFPYHHGPTNSLESNFKKSTHARSWARRSFKQHYGMLATKADILKVPAKMRADQYYDDTRTGKKLKLSDPNDLQIFAVSADINRKEVLDNSRNMEKRFDDNNTVYSDSSIDDTKYPY